MIRSSPTAADQARLAEVERLVTAARGILQEAANVLRDAWSSRSVGSDIGPDEAAAYMAEWQRLTHYIDNAPVPAYHYVCQSEWTGGSIRDPLPGTQTVVRWPSSFGTPVSEVK